MDELAKRFGELAAKYGPHAIDAARGAVQVEAISTIVSALIPASLAVALVWAARFMWKRRQECGDPEDAILAMLSGIAVVGAGICVACAVWPLIDPWTWTALYHPDLWIARRVFIR